MSDTYTEVYYHLVWTTKNREATIVPQIEETLYASIKAICRDARVTIHALNGLPDHVHLACTLPTTAAVAPLMNKIKGSSAHLINHLPANRYPLAWQPGYGALTFARRDLKTIVTYIQNQRQHHQGGTLSQNMECSHTERLFPSPGGAS